MNIVYSLLIYSFIGIFLLLTSLNNLTIFVIFILGKLFLIKRIDDIFYRIKIYTKDCIVYVKKRYFRKGYK